VEFTQEYRSLEALGGQQNPWALVFPSRCSLKEIRVQQVGGAFVAFTVKVFRAEEDLRLSQSSGGPDEDGAGDYEPDPYTRQVGQTLSSDEAGRLQHEWDPELGYVNMDSAGPSGKRHRLYLEVTPAGSGLQTYDVSITGRKAQAG
jgi:hypothetical protein